MENGYFNQGFLNLSTTMEYSNQNPFKLNLPKGLSIKVQPVKTTEIPSQSTSSSDPALFYVPSSILSYSTNNIPAFESLNSEGSHGDSSALDPNSTLLSPSISSVCPNTSPKAPSDTLNFQGHFATANPGDYRVSETCKK